MQASSSDNRLESSTTTTWFAIRRHSSSRRALSRIKLIIGASGGAATIALRVSVKEPLRRESSSIIAGYPSTLPVVAATISPSPIRISPPPSILNTALASST